MPRRRDSPSKSPVACVLNEDLDSEYKAIFDDIIHARDSSVGAHNRCAKLLENILSSDPKQAMMIANLKGTMSALYVVLENLVKHAILSGQAEILREEEKQ